MHYGIQNALGIPECTINLDTLDLFFGRPDDDSIVSKQFIKKIQQDATMYQNFIIPYLYEAQHVSGDTPPIITSIKLHWQPLVVHTWKVVGRLVDGRCQAQAWQRPPTPSKEQIQGIKIYSAFWDP